ncbi:MULTISPECIES: PaaI family thioesterase [Corallococcus]|uniref:PaaI family thioesterase n=1 Tax=Corallococcus TaxID=83461 RepID=UPI00117D546E|nr:MULTISPECIES: PaaI family thioesterase [Corallococcus]NBD07992.1 PaaI family thioesterase [Corallococcus silvisoli]TSC33976.1 PaaI family thioesterase [Corallococcus sp. Z5C101001]
MSDTPPPPPAPPSQAQLDRFAEQFNQSLTLRHFGAHMSFPEGRMVRVTLAPVQAQHRGGLGSSAVNGGIISALFDFAIGCTPALRDPTRRCATIQLSTSFERPATGDHLRVEAVIDHGGPSTLFASARLLDAEGRVCARCQGVVRVSSQPWANGESPATN